MIPRTARTESEGHRAEAPTIQELYDAHASHVRRLVAHLLGPGGDPEDVTQDVFLIAWRKLDTYRDENPRAWLSRIAVKRASYWRRRSWIGRMLMLEAAPADVREPRTPEDQALQDEARRITYSILNRMSEKRRTVLVLFELQGMTGEEIASALGCPLRTVHTRLFRARRDFKARLQAEPRGSLFDWSE